MLEQPQYPQPTPGVAGNTHYFDNAEFFAHVQVVTTHLTNTPPPPQYDAALSAAIAMARDVAAGFLNSTPKAHHIRHDQDAIQTVINQVAERTWKAIIRGRFQPPPPQGKGNPHSFITQIAHNELFRYLGRIRPY